MRRLGIGLVLMALATGMLGGCGEGGGIAERPEELLDVTVERQVRYSNDADTPGGWMDVFRPLDEGPWPVVVFLHGAADPRFPDADDDVHITGGCDPDCENFYDAHLTSLARRGTVVFLAGTEFRGNTDLGQIVEDVSCIGPFVAARAAEYGGSPDHTVVAGHSRGAVLGAALAFSGFDAVPAADCVEQGDSRPTPVGFVGLNGDYELMGKESSREPGKITFLMLGAGAFEPDEEPRDMGVTAAAAMEACSPYAHLGEDLPPAALFYGSNDMGAEEDMAERLAEELQSWDNEVTVSEYEGEHHESINLPPSWVEEAGAGDAGPAWLTEASAGNIEATLQLAYGSW